MCFGFRLLIFHSNLMVVCNENLKEQALQLDHLRFLLVYLSANNISNDFDIFSLSKVTKPLCNQ